MHLHVHGFVHGGQPGGLAGFHQVAGDGGLAVHHHVFAAGQAIHVDAVALAVEQQVKPAMHQPFSVHALAHTGFVQQVDAHLLQHTGPDAAQHVFAGLAFQNHRIDAGLVQQLPQQQARWASADDGHLCFARNRHVLRLVVWMDGVRKPTEACMLKPFSRPISSPTRLITD